MANGEELLAASNAGDADRCRHLLQGAVSAEARAALLLARDALQGTPLHRAALLGHTEVVAALLEPAQSSMEKWKLVSSVDKFSNTPLHCAACNGCVDVVVALLEQCQSSEEKWKMSTAQNDRGSTPLHVAAWQGQVQTAAILLEQGPCSAERWRMLLSVKDTQKKTPLQWAARHKTHGQECVLKLLCVASGSSSLWEVLLSLAQLAPPPVGEALGDKLPTCTESELASSGSDCDEVLAPLLHQAMMLQRGTDRTVVLLKLLGWAGAKKLGELQTSLAIAEEERSEAVKRLQEKEAALEAAEEAAKLAHAAARSERAAREELAAAAAEAEKKAANAREEMDATLAAAKKAAKDELHAALASAAGAADRAKNGKKKDVARIAALQSAKQEREESVDVAKEEKLKLRAMLQDREEELVGALAAAKKEVMAARTETIGLPGKEPRGEERRKRSLGHVVSDALELSARIMRSPCKRRCGSGDFRVAEWTC